MGWHDVRGCYTNREDILLMDTDGYTVLNGRYRLVEGSDGGLWTPKGMGNYGPNYPTFRLGRIMKLPISDRYNEPLTRFREEDAKLAAGADRSVLRKDVHIFLPKGSEHVCAYDGDEYCLLCGAAPSSRVGELEAQVALLKKQLEDRA